MNLSSAHQRERNSFNCISCMTFISFIYVTACRLMSQYGGDHLLGKTLPKALWIKGFSYILAWSVWFGRFGLGGLVW